MKVTHVFLSLMIGCQTCVARKTRARMGVDSFNHTVNTTNDDLPKEQYLRKMLNPDPTLTLCIKSGSSTNSDLKLKGYFDNYKYECTIHGIGKDKKKCCDANRISHESGLGQSFRVKLMDFDGNNVDGVKIRRIYFGEKSVGYFDAVYANWCDRPGWDGCIEFPRCGSGCTRESCTRLNEREFMLSKESNRVNCRESITFFNIGVFNYDYTCCYSSS